MAEPTYTLGRFVWHELYTPDVEASKAFYGALFGWQFRVDESGGMPYTLALLDRQPIGGFMPLNLVPMPNVPPHWLPYVSVASVEGAAGLAGAHGGKVVAGPRDIPAFGSFAVLMDPQGAVFAAWKSTKGDPPDSGPVPVGSFCWDSLNAADPAAAVAFYTNVVGWTTAAFGGGEGATVFKRGVREAASVNPAPPGVPTSWTSYVVVSALAAACEKAQKLGARLLMPPMALPGIGTFAIVADPAGAVVSLFEDAGRR